MTAQAGVGASGRVSPDIVDAPYISQAGVVPAAGAWRTRREESPDIIAAPYVNQPGRVVQGEREIGKENKK